MIRNHESVSKGGFDKITSKILKSTYGSDSKNKSSKKRNNKKTNDNNPKNNKTRSKKND